MSAGWGALGLVLLAVGACAAETTDPHAVRVVEYRVGSGGGFGEGALPRVVLGPPHGAGLSAGSADVFSLGLGGSIVLELGVDAVDGPGPDLLVFENPFMTGTMTFAEPAVVSVSSDGETFHEFPCDLAGGPTYPGCAGVHPVFASPDRPDIDPTDPGEAGGDPFDLAELGLPGARFVRIDASDAVAGLDGTSGFDLDALAVIPHE